VSESESVTQGGSESEREKERERVCVCVREREREKERERGRRGDLFSWPVAAGSYVSGDVVRGSDLGSAVLGRGSFHLSSILYKLLPLFLLLLLFLLRSTQTNYVGRKFIWSLERRHMGSSRR
jgi:hypothetical protein